MSLVVTIHLLSADHAAQGLDAVARLGAAAPDLGPAVRERVPYLRGVLVLGTCNRLALHVDAPDDVAPRRVAADVTTVLASHAGVRAGAVELTHAWGHDAHHHLFATAAGLESMVVGEREIAGQLRRASRRAAQEGTLSCILGRAVERASATSRRVARETGLAGTGRSVVAVGLDLAATWLPPLSRCRVLVVGTGAYAGATVAALRERGVADAEVYSRSDRAEVFAAAHGLRAVPDDASLAESVALADLVVTCRGLGAPVLTRALVEPATRLRRPAEPALHDRREVPGSHAEPAERPLVVLDLALTRDVEDAVADLPGVVHLDLARVQDAVPQAEARQVAEAWRIVEEEVDAFERLLDGRRMDPLVVALRSRVGAVVDEEIARLRPRVLAVSGPAPAAGPAADAAMASASTPAPDADPGPAPDAGGAGHLPAEAGDAVVPLPEVERALHHLAARLLHHPTVMARRAGMEGQVDAYREAVDLVLGLDLEAGPARQPDATTQEDTRD